MKPAPFRYFAPDSVEEVLALLHEHGWDAKLLAGGQSLIPTMNFRLAQPAVLIDLNRVAGLDFIERLDDGGLRIGAMTRERRLETDPLIAAAAPLVFETMPHIAHPQIRSRGTIGGSMAHADPAAELPAVARALGATFRVRGSEGERTVNADDFFLGLLTTVIEPTEMLTTIELPPMPARTGVAFEEVARRHGDYALVGVAVTVTVDEAGNCAEARIGMLSVADGPLLAAGGTAALIGQPLDSATIDAAAAIVAADDIDPPGDIHATPEYRRHLARVLVGRAVRRAAERALNASAPPPP